MGSRPPQFNAGTEIYRADSCQALRGAIAKGTLSMDALVHLHYPGEPLPKKTLPGLLSLGYWEAKHPQDWGLHWHRNEGLELTWVRNGTLDFMTVNHSQRMIPGEMAITGPWQLHQLGNPHISVGTIQWLILDQKIRNASQQWSWPSWIILSEEELYELTQQFLYMQNPICTASPKIAQYWEQIYKILRSDPQEREHSYSRIAILINELLISLLSLLRDHQDRGKKAPTDTVSPSHRVVQLFLEELRSIPRQLEYDWTVVEMAEICRMSRSQFSQYCHTQTGLPPMQYLNLCRIDLAKEQLRQIPRKSILDIALACGFSSSQYFATVFRKFTGISPGEYLQQEKNVEEDSSTI